MKTKHTPIPWAFTDNRATIKTAWDCVYGGPVPIAELNLYGPGRESQQANAAFIVEACNSHDALTAALDQCVEALTLCNRRIATFNQRGSRSDRDDLTASQLTIRAAIDAAKKAKE